jgi:type II secretory pathway component PulJ
MIEVLLAIGIFGLVMVAIYSSWSSILRGTRIGLTAAAEVQRTRVAIHALEASLSSTVMYADNPKYYSFYADTAGNYAFLSFVARLPESFPGSGLFAGQSLRRVTFEVDKERNLLLSQSTLLDISDHPYTIKLAPNTRVFAVEFFNQRRAEWLPEWISTNQLPVMVRVAIDFGDKNVANEPVTIRTIPLTAMAITRVGGGMPTPNVANVPQAPGAPGMNNGGVDVVGDEAPQWAPNLPGGFWDNRGNAQLNPVFPH